MSSELLMGLIVGFVLGVIVGIILQKQVKSRFKIAWPGKGTIEGDPNEKKQ